MSITLLSTRLAVSICMSTGHRINMAVNAMRSFGQWMRDVMQSPSPALLRFYFFVPFSIATTMTRFFEATFAVTVRHLADFCQQMFSAPTSRRIGAIPTARARSHEQECTQMFEGVR
jgi:hypothetical protein